MTRRAGVLLFTALMAAGCGADGDPVRSADDHGLIDGPVLRSAPSDRDEGDGAIVQGVLVLDGDCLFLEFDRVRSAVIWPHGTGWQPEPPAVVLTGGEVVEVGATVTGGGGYRDGAGRLEHGFGRAVADAAAACVGPADQVAVFNPGSTVEPGLP